MLALRRVRRVIKSIGAPAVAVCILISVLAGCQPGSQSEATVDPNATANARAVLRYLDDLPNQPTNKILSGQQAVVRQYDLYDTDWSAIHNLTGQTPAILGIDYFHWTPRSDPDYKDFDFNAAVSNARAKAQWQAGGLVFMSSHMYNPITGATGDDNAAAFPTPAQAANMVRGGTSENAALNRMLDRIAGGLLDLQASGVVVVWKPFHEWNFWWAPYIVGQSNLRALWRYTQNYMIKTKGVHNVLWMYSPKADPFVMDPAVFPGDDVVDLVGISEYDSPSPTTKFAQYDQMVTTGKVYGLGEFGSGSGSSSAAGAYDMTQLLAAITHVAPRTSFIMNWWDEWGIQRSASPAAYMNDPRVANLGEVNWRKYLPGGSSSK